MKYKQFFALSWFCIISVAYSQFAQAAPDAGFTPRLATANSWKLWPKDTGSTLKGMTQDNTLELQVKKPTTIYQWLSLEPATLYHITFAYRANFAAQHPEAKIGLSFRGRERRQSP